MIHVKSHIKGDGSRRLFVAGARNQYVKANIINLK